MERNRKFSRIAIAVAVAFAAAGLIFTQPPAPEMLDNNLAVATAVSGLTTPVSMAFLSAQDFLVLEKNTGKVQRIVNGTLHSTPLDLSVNNASERGLLGIALHPQFPSTPWVYLFWTCHSTLPPASPFFPDEQMCLPSNFTGSADVSEILQTPLLGNRVDRFVWDGAASTLTFDRNIIMLRSFQHDGGPPDYGDADQPPRGNHNGGVLRFGPDGKLYVLFGDQGRRGQLQNTTDFVPDDQFGGPEPDNAHLSGVILRLNDDGSAPSDNPFFAVGEQMGGQAGANIQKIFVYGLRNSFGMAFDPRSGSLWYQENGEDAFDEINRAEPGVNGGWIQVAGPSSRVGEYKQIETTSLHGGEDFPNLQQFRWGPERIADTPQQALSRLFLLPGARYSEPEFSWKFVIAPGGLGFMNGAGIGPQFSGDMFLGLAVPLPMGGPLLHFQITGNRRMIGVEGGDLEDRVADNSEADVLAGSEQFVIGRNFGVVTDIQTGPDGNLYVVSLTNGSVYRITRRQQ
jgi:glucose/arabinose dehydrogenase